MLKWLSLAEDGTNTALSARSLPFHLVLCSCTDSFRCTTAHLPLLTAGPSIRDKFELGRHLVVKEKTKSYVMSSSVAFGKRGVVCSWLVGVETAKGALRRGFRNRFWELLQVCQVFCEKRKQRRCSTRSVTTG